MESVFVSLHPPAVRLTSAVTSLLLDRHWIRVHHLQLQVVKSTESFEIDRIAFPGWTVCSPPRSKQSAQMESVAETV